MHINRLSKLLTILVHLLLIKVFIVEKTKITQNFKEIILRVNAQILLIQFIIIIRFYIVII